MKVLFTGYYARHGKLSGAVSISVRPPNWFPSMAHCAALAPPAEIVRRYKAGLIPEIGYTILYNTYLNHHLNRTPQEVADSLPDRSILLCYEKPPKFCHRYLAAKWLMEHVPDLVITELEAS